MIHLSIPNLRLAMSAKMLVLLCMVLALCAATDDSCPVGISCAPQDSSATETIDTEAASASLNLLQVGLSAEVSRPDHQPLKRKVAGIESGSMAEVDHVSHAVGNSQTSGMLTAPCQ